MLNGNALVNNVIRESNKMKGGVEITKWENGMILAGEGLGSLALANDIFNKTRNLNQGEVMVCSDNEHVLNNI